MPELLGGTMLIFGEFGALITLVLTVYSLVDVITTEDSQPHGLPKLVWVLIVLFAIPPVGAIVWLVVSRRARVGTGPRPGGYERQRPEYPEYDRPGRFAAADPRADAEFLRQVRERAEEQRRRYRQSKKESGGADEDPPGGDRPEPPSEGDRPG